MFWRNGPDYRFGSANRGEYILALMLVLVLVLVLVLMVVPMMVVFNAYGKLTPSELHPCFDV